MKAIMASTGGRAPPPQNTRSPCAGSRWPGAAPGSPAPAPSAAPVPRSSAAALAPVALGLPDPLPQRLGRAADFRRHRAHRRPFRRVLPRLLSNHPNRTLAQLGRIGLHRPLGLHGSTLSDVGAS